MNPVQKALWFVESHSGEPVTLEAVAAACHVSMYHITRAFAASTGVSLMRYLRARRLSEAARRLANGAPDILQVALDAGYGSHEAFTRAFREQFALPPEQVRAQGHLNNLRLIDPLIMSTAPVAELPAPRYETAPSRLFAGLVERYHCEASGGIPGQWQRFAPHLAAMPPEMSRVAYGITANFDREGNFDYLCGVEVKDGTTVPAGLTTLRLPEQRYAVFRHAGHVAGIRSTVSAIWSHWFPASGHEPADAPMIERYGPEFNPVTGQGGFEIWIPIKA